MLTKAELNDLTAQMQEAEDYINRLNRRAILLYNVLSKISNRLDEIDQKAGGKIDWEEFQAMFNSTLKGVC
ncbi:MAG: hypothetical protein IJT73_00670 [Selenomonadaceae bacterium]|nr:hypothetical protein [Selenomonadaceae bacterium]